MLFNTGEFAIFFTIILAAYWLLFKWRHLQNIVLLGGSMYFYGQLHYSFPIYLSAIIIVSYLFGNLIEKIENDKRRRLFTIIGICVLSIGLVYTKYSELFFANIPGLEHWKASALHILVPVGISFYTFSTVGYIVDVYRRTVPAERKLLTYATYISFFPHLLSGPIPAAATVLPEFNKTPRITLYAVDEGIGEIIWGLFKKMVVADNLTLAISFCFSGQYKELSGSTLFIGATLFGMQLYADFSGYSSIARGLAKLLGIEVVQNFRMPYFASNITEYWRRWHISLTAWFNAYIFNPTVVSLRNLGKGAVICGLMLTFSLSGIWHGAGWQFVLWGVIHGLAMTYEYLTKKKRKKLFKKMPVWLNDFLSTILLLCFLNVAWIFFRASSVQESFGILSHVFSASIVTAPTAFVTKYLKWCIPMIAIEWIQRKGDYTMDMQQWLRTKITRRTRSQVRKKTIIHVSIKVLLYTALSVAIYLFYKKQNLAEYYYFKF